MGLCNAADDDDQTDPLNVGVVGENVEELNDVSVATGGEKRPTACREPAIVSCLMIREGTPEIDAVYLRVEVTSYTCQTRARKKHLYNISRRSSKRFEGFVLS